MNLQNTKNIVFIKSISIVVMFFLFSQFVSAHPLDISQTHFTIHEKGLSATTYLHSFEGQFFASKVKGSPVYEFQTLFEYKKELLDYVSKHVKIQNNQKECRFIAEDVPNKDDHFLLSEGYEVYYSFECDAPLENLGVTNTLFVDDFELQTNKMSFFKAENGNFAMKNQKVFNKSITSFVWNVQESVDLTIQDDDKDGLSNDDERSFKTDPKKPDTDGDNYGDFEEIQFSWDPINAELGPGQKDRRSVAVANNTSSVSPILVWLENIFLKVLEWLR